MIKPSGLVTRIDVESIPVWKSKTGLFSEKEQELALTICHQIHNLVEVRYSISAMPAFGQCQGDSLFYTREPSSGV